MKRLVVVLSSLLVLPAFAEVAPSFYYDEPEMTDVELTDIELDEVAPEAETATPAPVVNKKPTVAAARQAMTGRTTKSRTTTARTTTNRSGVAARVPTTRANTTASRSISSRMNASTPVRTSNVSSRRATTPMGVTSRTGTKARAGVVNTTTRLYNPNNITVQQRGSSIRTTNVRTATITNNEMASVASADDIIETTNGLDAMKSLTEYCQAQYTACMDNYCNVLDDNQGRCSCSKNISSYEKTEAALQSATEALQDVARAIQYIGLTSDQITTLFKETEAELTMKNEKDNSAIRADLDKVKRMIVDVKTGTATSVADSNAMNFDLSGLLDFNISSVGFDLSSFMNTTSNTNSISNQRGESLFKTATARCKASVLNSCVAQGVDAAMVTNSYDLEIDKSCLAYERALTESNQQMSQTVANAKEVLKKARLMVAQNKNAYDLRGCVSALESCMQDDYVCGSDYENCLDPTGQYIVNGAVVTGSMPGNNTDVSPNDANHNYNVYSHDNLFNTWTVNNESPWVAPDTSSGDITYITLAKYINDTVTNTAAKNSSDKMVAYLQNKIGWHDNKTNKDYGMCMNVLNQCQNYTYTTKSTKVEYNPTNEVIKHFLQRAVIQIKARQDELLASYAEDCINDVSSCLSTNNYDENNPEGTKSRAAINSCYAQIKTCMSVNGNIFGSVSPDELRTWVTGTYSAIETVSSTDEWDNYCHSLVSDGESCNTAKVYYLNNGAGTLTTSACRYTAASETTAASCNRNGN